MPTTMTTIQEFLSEKRFAMIGLSRDPKEFSVRLFSDFVARGYEVLPVNPAQREIFGYRCYSHIGEIQPPVTAALLMTPRSLDLEITRQCADAKVRMVWLYGVHGPKRIDPEVIRFCESSKIDLVAGYCPFMFLPEGAFFHRFHGAIARVFGTYPR